MQVVEHLFKDNDLAAGRFVALSRKVDLSELGCPLFLLAARDDDVVAPEQIFATEHLVDRQRCSIQKAVAPCGHLGLFMGKEIPRPDLAGYRALALALIRVFAARCGGVCRRGHIPHRRTNHTFTKCVSTE